MPKTQVYRFNDYRRKKKGIFCFTRPELNLLLSIYTNRVISGEWKAYAIDHESGRAQFSIFTHARAQPVFTIIKHQRTTNKTRKYMVMKGGSRIAQDDNLSHALSIFKSNLRLVSN